MAEDPKWELALLATVQSFYQRLMGDHLGGEIPDSGTTYTRGCAAYGRCPQHPGLHEGLDSVAGHGNHACHPAAWHGHRPGRRSGRSAASHFARHRDDSATNRDKTDLVATLLFRHPRVAGQWERSGYGLDGSLPLSPFEIALLEILSESQMLQFFLNSMCNGCASSGRCSTKPNAFRIPMH